MHKPGKTLCDILDLKINLQHELTFLKKVKALQTFLYCFYQRSHPAKIHFQFAKT